MPDRIDPFAVDLAEEHARLLPLRVAAAPIPYAAYRKSGNYPDDRRALILALDFYEATHETTDYDRRLFAEVREAMDRPGYLDALARKCFARVSEAEEAERFRTRTRY